MKKPSNQDVSVLPPDGGLSELVEAWPFLTDVEQKMVRVMVLDVQAEFGDDVDDVSYVN